MHNMNVTLVEDNQSLIIRIPMRMKKRAGRKEIIVPEGLIYSKIPSRATYQKALVNAFARAYRWQEILESGKYSSIKEMADTFGLKASYMSRIMRLTRLAPDIVEAILRGDEPSGLSLNMLVKEFPWDWEKQRVKFGFIV